MIANMFATKSGNWFTKEIFGFIVGGGGVATTPSKLVPLSLWFVILGTRKCNTLMVSP